MTAGELRERIGGEWKHRPDGWWLALEPAGVRRAARICLAAGGRFSALLACPEAAGGLRLSWHWDLGGVLLSLRASFERDVAVPSIADLCPGADWAERETRDYYGVAFEGRPRTEPLVLRDGDAPGIMARRQGEPR